jgi:hypothetical protein
MARRTFVVDERIKAGLETNTATGLLRRRDEDGLSVSLASFRRWARRAPPGRPFGQPPFRTAYPRHSVRRRASESERRQPASLPRFGRDGRMPGKPPCASV